MSTERPASVAALACMIVLVGTADPAAADHIGGSPIPCEAFYRPDPCTDMNSPPATDRIFCTRDGTDVWVNSTERGLRIEVDERNASVPAPLDQEEGRIVGVELLRCGEPNSLNNPRFPLCTSVDLPDLGFETFADKEWWSEWWPREITGDHLDCPDDSRTNTN